MASSEPVNGVDVTRLFETLEAVKADPALGKFHFRATSEWDNGALTRTTIKDFYGAGADDTSRSANPTEAVLHALASCLTVGMTYNAAARGIKIDKLGFDLEGDLDLQGFLGLSDDVRSGYSDIRVTCNIEADASREDLEELCQYAQDHSPVFDIVSNPVTVAVKLAD